MVSINQHAKFQVIPPIRSPENDWIPEPTFFFTYFTNTKCYKNKENKQTATKIQSVLKVVKIHEHTKFHAILLLGSQKMTRNCHFDLFYEVKMPPKWGRSAYHDKILIGMSNFRPLIPNFPKKNAQKPQIWPVSQNQITIKMTTINRSWPKFNQFLSWSGHTFQAISPLRFLFCFVFVLFFRKCLETRFFTCFTKSKWHQN